MNSSPSQEISQLASIKFCNMIRRELQFNSEHLNSRQLQDLVQDILFNIYTGFLVGDDYIVHTFSLLYRIQKNIEHSRNREIPLEKLSQWVGNEKNMEVLKTKIKEVVQNEEKYLFTKKIVIKNQPDFQESFQYSSKMSSLKKSYSPKQSKQLNSSPSTAKNSHHQHQSLSFEHQMDNHNHQDSDLFQILTFNKDCATPYQQNFKEQQKECEKEEEKINFDGGDKDGLYQEEHIAERKYEESMNNSKESEENPYFVIKLTSDQPKEEVDQQLISEVSSFADQQNFISMICSHQLQETSRYGHFLYGDKIEEILNIFKTKETIFVLVKWLPRKNGIKPLQSVLETPIIKEHCPQLLMDFYEKQLK